uniref:Fructose-2,6-bisphosphatase TIGAR B-like n=2 Tax=Hirondellea gigas TaxID=1518452 RepID=A0A2P2I905_9CRUS
MSDTAATVKPTSTMLRSNKNSSVLFQLICIRHGETDSNREKRIQGHIDIPLNALGLEQAKRAGIALSSQVFSRAYCSDLSRTEQTARQILQQTAMSSPPDLVVDARIKERYFGVVENMLYNDVLKLLDPGQLDWSAYVAEKGETLGEVEIRFVNFFKTLCQSVYDKHKAKSSEENGSTTEHSNDLSNVKVDFDIENGHDDEAPEDCNDAEEVCENVLMVSHGAALRLFYSHMEKTLHCTVPEPKDIFPLNTAYSVFKVRYSPRRYKVTCQTYNKADHIKDIDLSTF